jgi:hypothetical protein
MRIAKPKWSDEEVTYSMRKENALAGRPSALSEPIGG